jgi:hypothetical protein
MASFESRCQAREQRVIVANEVHARHRIERQTPKWKILLHHQHFTKFVCNILKIKPHFRNFRLLTLDDNS